MPRPDDEERETSPLEDIEEGSLEDFPGKIGSLGETEMDTDSWENRINQYRTASESLEIDPELIYEPANGADISTSEAFPNSDILYAEIRDNAVEAVNKAGENVVLGDGEELKLSSLPDLVVFRNSHMDEVEALTRNPAEYVFANNWTGSASNIAKMDEYEITGIVPQNETYLEDAESVEDGETPDDLYVFEKL